MKTGWTVSSRWQSRQDSFREKARLNERNALLNPDRKGNELVDGEQGGVAKSIRRQRTPKITAAMQDICNAAIKHKLENVPGV